MQEFINPKSMMTPGIAGTMMMFLVNALLFAFPELSGRVVALVLSFLIGSVVFASRSKNPPPIWIMAVYWIVNSLIIFAVGFGTAHFAATPSTQESLLDQGKTFLASWLPSAHAQSGANDAIILKSSLAKPEAREVEMLEQMLQRERRKNEELKQELEAAQAQKTPDQKTAKVAEPPPNPPRAAKKAMAPPPDLSPNQMRFFKSW